MEGSGRQLWRKIGLEKNFLQGTSYSDQSVVTILSKEDLYPAHSVSQASLKGEQKSSGNEHKKHYGNFLRPQDDFSHQFQKDSSHCQKPQVQSPINRLSFSSFEQKCVQWMKKFKGVDTIKQRTENQMQSKKDEIYKRYGYESGSEISQQFETSIKNSLMLHSDIPVMKKVVGSTSYHKINPGYRSGHFNGKTEDIRFSKRQKNYDESQVQSYNTKNEIEVVSCEQMFTLSLKDYRRFEYLDYLFKKVHENDLPKIWILVKQLYEENQTIRTEIADKIKTVKEQMLYIIKENVQSKLRQYIDEIGFLYQQNKTLINSLQQKNVSITKFNSQIEQLSKRLSQINDNKQKQIIDKDNKIQQQQNIINQLYQRMEDVYEIQGKNEFLNNRIRELECFIKQMENRLNETNSYKKALEQKKQLILELQTQINQLHIQHQSSIYQLKMQHQHQIEQKQLKVKFKVQQLQSNHRSQLQKSNNSSAVHAQYQSLIKELMNKINSLQIDNIIKKFTIQKNQNLLKIMNKLIKQQKYPKRQEISRQHNQIEQDALESPHFKKSSSRLKTEQVKNNSGSGSDNQTPNFNLRKTGFFGQPKPNLTIKLQDIIKKSYKAQNTATNQSYIVSRSPQPHNYIQKSISPQKSSKIQLSPFFHKRQNSEIFYQPEQQKVLKVCQTNRDRFNQNQISFTNSLYYRPEEQQLSQNKNSLSSLNFQHLNSPTNGQVFKKADTHREFFKNVHQQERYKERKQSPDMNDLVERIRHKLNKKFQKDQGQKMYTQRSYVPTYARDINGMNEHQRQTKVARQESEVLKKFYEQKRKQQLHQMIYQNKKKRSSSPQNRSRSRSTSSHNYQPAKRLSPSFHKPSNTNFIKLSKPTGNIITSSFPNRTVAPQRSEFGIKLKRQGTNNYQYQSTSNLQNFRKLNTSRDKLMRKC